MTTTPTFWQTQITVNAVHAAGANAPGAVIGLANGNILNGWLENSFGSPGNDIDSQLFSAQGISIGGFVQLNTVSTADNEFMGDMVALPGGGFIVAYVDDQGAAADTIRLERYNANGAVVFSTVIAAGGTVSNPELGVAPNGNYVLTFTRDVAGDQNVRAQVFNGVTNAAVAEFDAAQNGADDFFAGESTSLTNNNFVTAYVRDPAAGAATIEFKIVTGAGVQVVAPTTVGNGFQTDVAALTGGGFVVVYNDSNDIKFRVATNAGAQGAAVTVAGGANAQNIPKVVGLKDGGFFVAWHDSTATDLIGQRYDAAGLAVGANLIIDATSTAPAHELGLTTDGRILTSWFDGEIAQVILDPRDIIINGTSASDVITTRLEATQVFAGNGLDTIFGQAGNDIIQGGGQVDTIFGGAGNDSIVILENEFVDNVDGGADSDTLDLSAITSRFAVIDMAAGTWNLSPSFGGPVTIANIEIVKGTQLGDSIAGGAGTQTLEGGFGGDTLSGGAAIDTLRGGDGDDTLKADADGANDILDGQAGTGDTADMSLATSGVTVTLTGAFSGTATGGGLGTDTFSNVERVLGSSFADTITGLNGNDQLFGGNGNDTIFDGGGVDAMDGGDGDDTFRLVADSVAGDTIIGGVGANDVLDLFSATSGVTVTFSGADFAGAVVAGGNIGAANFSEIERIYGSVAQDTITGGSGGEYLYTRAGNDIVNGGGGNDLIYGDLGNDTLRDGAGTDFVHGGDNDDTLQADADGTSDSFDGAAGTIDALDLSLATGAATVIFGATPFAGNSSGGGLGTDSFFNIERIVGSAFADAITGANSGEDLRGAAGNDTINGDAGNDFLSGGGDADVLRDGSGADTLNGDAGDDQIVLDPDATTENLINGGDGTADILDLFNATNATTVTFSGGGGGTVTGGGLGNEAFVNIERLFGGVFNDTVTCAGASDDFIFTRGGNDVIDAGGGNDTVQGDFGNDTIKDGAGIDSVNGGADNDTFILAADAQDDDIAGAGGTADTIDLINATVAASVLFNATAFAGQVSGGGIGIGNFTDVERILGSNFADTILGRGGAETLLGRSGSDTISGDAGNDSIDGGDSGDFLVGGGGTDSLTGGAGGDTFDFNTGSGSDNVNDFVNDADTLRIDPLYGFADAAAVVAATTAFGTAARINLPGGFSIFLGGYLATNTIASLADDIVIA